MSSLFLYREGVRQQLSGESKAHARAVHLEALRHFTVYFPSREAKHSLEQWARRQGIVFRSDRCFVLKLICSKLVPNVTEKHNGWSLESHAGGKDFREKRGIPEFTRLFSWSHFTYRLLYGHNPKFQCSMQTLVIHLRHFAVGWGTRYKSKPAGSFIVVVIGILYWHKPFDNTVALIDSASNRNE